MNPHDPYIFTAAEYVQVGMHSLWAGALLGVVCASAFWILVWQICR